MAKYRKKPVIVDAQVFKMGMEDGYMDVLVSLGEGIRGVKQVKKPYIQTLEGRYPVEEDKHYIVTGVRGERYPVEKEIFEETYELVEDRFGITNMTLSKLKALPNERVIPLSQLKEINLNK